MKSVQQLLIRGVESLLIKEKIEAGMHDLPDISLLKTLR
ncbi:hypothetical protein SLEP1_g9135 [Rubroshorea leprosula]|uniref:Uncharacterized protein n=1 Tax=Rubroshorea leprosula TaxID=152421 RepID=A0AAV5I9W3_9ROSI|nr:hypothetical protein SLEP1_g9135 [Rubroshorea leprosula]